MNTFTLLVGASALFVAGCAAFFSVRGIGLLFAGSMIPVIIMASSLEIAKLVAASFLYRAWKDISVLMKFYMTVGVVFLVGITSLGIYGYLSDAFEDTKSRVYVYESNIQQLEKENIYLEDEIKKVESSAGTVDEKAKESEATFQKIYDDFIDRQEAQRSRIMSRLSEMDEEVANLESKPGGLFSSKKKDLQLLKDSQLEERDDIKSRLKTLDTEADLQYKEFLAKVDNLRQTTQQVDVQPKVQELYTKIKANNESVLDLKQQIKNTDIGSFKFIARSFNIELEQAVKWFIIVIVIVFDPMAVTLVIAYNIMLIRTGAKKKILNYATKKEAESEAEIIPQETEKEVEQQGSIQTPPEVDEVSPGYETEILHEDIPEKTQITNDHDVDLDEVSAGSEAEILQKTTQENLEVTASPDSEKEIIDNLSPSEQNKSSFEKKTSKTTSPKDSIESMPGGLKRTLEKSIRQMFSENPALRRYTNKEDLLEKLYSDKKISYEKTNKKN